MHDKLECRSKSCSSMALRCMWPACHGCGRERCVQAEVLTAALHADAWPHLTLALGLATGQVLLLRGEAGVPPLTCAASAAHDEHVKQGVYLQCCIRLAALVLLQLLVLCLQCPCLGAPWNGTRWRKITAEHAAGNVLPG